MQGKLIKAMIASFVIIPVVALATQPVDLSKVRIHPRANAVALTFDDGPSPKYTRKILAILDRYHIKATFFVMGIFAKRYPELIKAIQQHGHIIANHSMSHPYLTRTYGKKLYYQVVEPNIIIKKITGYTPVCLRPPFGLYNNRVKTFIESQHMRMVMWDLNTFDYKRQPVAKLVSWVLTKTKPGYDLLMHDGSGNSFQTVQALPAIIEGLRKRGMKFDVICEPRQ